MTTFSKGFYFSGAGNLLSTAIPHSAASPLHSGIFVSIRARIAVQVASTGSATTEIAVFCTVVVIRQEFPSPGGGQKFKEFLTGWLKCYSKKSIVNYQFATLVNFQF